MITNGVNYYGVVSLLEYTYREDEVSSWWELHKDDGKLLKFNHEDMSCLMDEKLIEGFEGHKERVEAFKSGAIELFNDNEDLLNAGEVKITTYLGEKLLCNVLEFDEAGMIIIVDDMLLFQDGKKMKSKGPVPFPAELIVKIEKLSEFDQKLYDKAFESEYKFGTDGHPQLPPELQDMLGPRKGRVKSEPVKLPKGYSPDFINASMDIHEVARKLKIALSKKTRPNAITILLSGVAGTGKTLAAKYVCKKIGKELRTVKLGEILKKYVGETEQTMVKLFKDASEEGHCLLIDEIDSLSMNRDSSDRHYQVQMVNSLLQCLDDFEGVAFFTTNSTDRMDTAVMRRVLLEIKFENLTGEQADKAAAKFFPRRKIKGLESGMYAPSDMVKARDGLLFVDDKEINKHYIMDRLKSAAISRNGSKKSIYKGPVGFQLGG